MKLNSQPHLIASLVSGALVRKGVDMAMRLMGEQFVTGETISQALANARKLEDKGFRYSYDMLGEAALTKKMHKITWCLTNKLSTRLVKHQMAAAFMKALVFQLSYLHYIHVIAAQSRVMEELYPRLLSLVLQAHQYEGLILTQKKPTA